MADLVDPTIAAELARLRIDCCLIGGAALAVWGYARYTADVDLLTLDARVLTEATWIGFAQPFEIRRGDVEDPLCGVVRFSLDPPLDLIVGKGQASRVALASAQRFPEISVPVASPAGLTLLKLEAGSLQDRADILALLSVQRALGNDAWLGAVVQQIPKLTRSGRAAWKALQPDLKASGFMSKLP